MARIREVQGDIDELVPVSVNGFGRHVDGTRIGVGFMSNNQAKLRAGNLIAATQIATKQQTRAKRPEKSGYQKSCDWVFTRFVTHAAKIIQL